MAGGEKGPGAQLRVFGTRTNGSVNAAIGTFGSCYVQRPVVDDLTWKSQSVLSLGDGRGEMRYDNMSRRLWASRDDGAFASRASMKLASMSKSS